jgi:(p)ppGpp synthase/HD superfamily hydrolase
LIIEKQDNYLLSERFEEAIVFAARIHRRQIRKQSSIPYMAHLLGVTSLVLEDGGDEDEAIAALLHDAVEDQGGIETLEVIHNRFGKRVADIVLGCTDSLVTPKPPWRERKTNFIESIKTANDSIRRVALADKVYNAWATLRDIRREGQVGWNKFNGGRSGTLWYYRQMIEVFEISGTNSLLEELKQTIIELESISKID